MKIKEFEVYKDGGTIKIVTDKKTHYIDGRIHSSTKNKIFTSYPSDNNEYLKNSEELLKQIAESLKSFKNIFYQELIDDFILKYS